MKIEVFGMGCPNCSKLEANVKKALDEAGMTADIVKVDKLDEIVARGIMGTPALAIDGELKSSGKVLSAAQVKALLS
jgi:small redox-active disulfide protein 2